MRTTIPISPDSPNPDKDLIKAYTSVSPIRHSSTGNQLLLYRAGIGVRGNFWVSTAHASHGDIGIINDTVIWPFSEPADSIIGRGRMLWEDPDVETAAIVDASGFAHFEQALRIVNTGSIGMADDTTFTLAMANISTPTTPARIDAFRAWFEDYILAGIQDETQKIREYYEEQLAIKESEIETLSDELSQIKTEHQQQNHEPEQIKSQYKEEITKIPEVHQALYKQSQREIQFLVVLDDMRRDISDQLGEIEDHLEASFTSWLFDFEYIGHRISSQQHQNAYIEFFARD